MAITKIMLVEDDADDRDLFTAAMSRIDTPVTLCYAQDGVDALEQLAADECKDVQLILLDVNMPRMNGWEVLKRLKDDPHFTKIPVIMLSTSSERDSMEQALTMGAVAFISKPAEFDHIVHLVRVIVALPKDRVERVLKDYMPGQ